MKHWFRRIIIPALALVFCIVPAAADPLPASTPHRVLVDRVVPMAHLEQLDGSAAAPAASLSRWRQVLHELRRSAEAPAAWPDPALVAATAAKAASVRTVPLGLIHAAYDRLESSGVLTSGEVFALGALRPRIYYGAAVEFRLDEADLIRHMAAPILRLRLDPGDGGGWRVLTPGKPLPAAYPATGVKTLRLEADLADGRTLQAAALLTVVRLATPDPTETWPITATVPYDGLYGSGQAYLYLAPGHAGLTNPVVVVEGFDLDNTMDWPVLYDLLNQENLIEDMRAEGFDAVVLDFTEATEPIQRNAFVLTELLAQVRAAAPEGRSQALIGASMGGLVCRYALLWLEDQGIEHRVRTFISFDSPQKGANIPLGLQYWLHFFRNESADANLLLSRLNTPAARQMLLYHYLSTNGTIPGPDPVLTDIQAELTAMGGWPVQPWKVSVANGSGMRADQGFVPGEQLIEYRYRSFLVDIDGNVWAVPDGNSQIIFDGVLNKIWPLPDSYLTVTVEGTLPWDSAPGGSRASMAQMDTTAVPYGDIIALYDNHCFIPTISSLALDVADPFFDIAGAADLASLTPFDEVHFPAENQEHITVTPESKPWFLDAVRLGVSGVEDGHRPVAGDARLMPAYPNPFNPQTRLGFELAEPATISLRVFDMTGRAVRTLVDGVQFGAGRFAVPWQGLDDRGRPIPSGVYVYRLEAGPAALTGRVTLLK